MTVILYNCLVGISYLHDMGVIHRDLKPANILVDNECQIRIADYGLARGHFENNRSKSPHVVTRNYRAPEVAIGESYDSKVDLFSMGVILYEFMTVIHASSTIKDKE